LSGKAHRDSNQVVLTRVLANSLLRYTLCARFLHPLKAGL